MVTRLLQNPARLNAFKTEACPSAPTTTSIAGAPNIPSSATSQPAFFSNPYLAAASAVKFAVVAPVTSPPSQSAGRCSASQIQPSATSSSSTPTGDITRKPAFWSHALANQLAASDAGKAPPVTKPKYLPPAVATVAGEPNSSSIATTLRGSLEFSGKASWNLLSSRICGSVGATLRSLISPAYRCPRSAAKLSASSPYRWVSCFGFIYAVASMGYLIGSFNLDISGKRVRLSRVLLRLLSSSVVNSQG